jgi:hypothetical protein
MKSCGRSPKWPPVGTIQSSAAVIAIALSMLVSGCGPNSSFVERNFLLQLKVVVDGELKEASTVQQYRLEGGGGSGQGSVVRFETNVFGEALFVDLGARHPALVVLMRHKREQAYSQVFAACVSGGKKIDDLFKAMKEFVGSCEVPLEYVPTLISVADPWNPGTIAPLKQPSKVGDVISAGVAFTSLTVTSSTAETSKSLETQLPFLKHANPENIYDLGHGESPNGLPLSSDAFFRTRFD